MKLTGRHLRFRQKSPGSRARRIAEMLRVNHAGEYGAARIYRGQLAVLGARPGKRRTAETVRAMERGEAAHLAHFERLINERGVRPTLLSPIWNVAGFGLGAATALLGEKAAMTCTAAVEDVIEKHYAAQADELDGADPDLARTIRRFRDEELAHGEAANAAGAREAPFHGAMSAAIKAGCRLAIRLAEKL